MVPADVAAMPDALLDLLARLAAVGEATPHEPPARTARRRRRPSEVPPPMAELLRGLDARLAAHLRDAPRTPAKEGQQAHDALLRRLLRDGHARWRATWDDLDAAALCAAVAPPRARHSYVRREFVLGFLAANRRAAGYVRAARRAQVRGRAVRVADGTATALRGVAGGPSGTT